MKKVLLCTIFAVCLQMDAMKNDPSYNNPKNMTVKIFESAKMNTESQDFCDEAGNIIDSDSAAIQRYLKEIQQNPDTTYEKFILIRNIMDAHRDDFSGKNYDSTLYNELFTSMLKRRNLIDHLNNSVGDHQFKCLSGGSVNLTIRDNFTQHLIAVVRSVSGRVLKLEDIKNTCLEAKDCVVCDLINAVDFNNLRALLDNTKQQMGLESDTLYSLQKDQQIVALSMLFYYILDGYDRIWRFNSSEADPLEAINEIEDVTYHLILLLLK